MLETEYLGQMLAVDVSACWRLRLRLHWRGPQAWVSLRSAKKGVERVYTGASQLIEILKRRCDEALADAMMVNAITVDLPAFGDPITSKRRRDR